MARDEWPLLAVSVSHALVHWADDVLAIITTDDDASIRGLRRLRGRWGDRLNIAVIDAGQFLQAATTNLAFEMIGAPDRDWLYVFDADEFLVERRHGALRSAMAACPPDTSAIRYEVLNWVSSRAFREDALSDYVGLSHRSTPGVPGTWGPSEYRSAVLSGRLTYFDVPFVPKVIVRAERSTWIDAGAHGMRAPVPSREVTVPESVLFAAHVPLLSRDRLDRRVAHGEALRVAGFHRDHGWQNQLLAEMSAAGTLDAFWARHSVDDESGGPPYVKDRSLADALRLTIRTSGPALPFAMMRRAVADGVAAPYPEATVPAHVALGAIRRLEVVTDGDRERRRRAHLALEQERDRLAKHRAVLAATVAARDDLIVSLTGQRDALDAEIAALRATRGWRLAEMLRRLGRRGSRASPDGPAQ